MLFYRVKTYLRAFIFICPVSGAFSRLPELFYFLFMLFIFRRRKFIPALFILPPVGEISMTSDMQMTPPYGRKGRGTKKPLDEGERGE